MNPYPANILFDISIANATEEEAVRYIFKCFQADSPHKIYFVNAHCVNITQRNAEYMDALQHADAVFADGVGMQIAAKVLGHPLVDNVNGTDLFPLLCHALNKTPARLYLLGAEPGVAEALAARINREYPNIPIVGCHHGHFSDEENEAVAQQITQSQAELLLVAMGVPKQELWIERWIETTGVRAAVGVGGLFNFYSGKIARAPRWMQRCGLEWLHRLVQEPGRLWKRYLIGNIKFLVFVFQKRFRSNHRD